MVISMREQGTSTYKEIGRSERVKDNSNPVWSYRLVLDYFFEENQELKLEVGGNERLSRLSCATDRAGALRVRFTMWMATPRICRTTTIWDTRS